ncbi:MAG: hypothetical protein ACTHME_04385 [Candidatus Nitrosocosmicus sp.]
MSDLKPFHIGSYQIMIAGPVLSKDPSKLDFILVYASNVFLTITSFP